MTSLVLAAGVTGLIVGTSAYLQSGNPEFVPEPSRHAQIATITPEGEDAYRKIRTEDVAAGYEELWRNEGMIR